MNKPTLARFALLLLIMLMACDDTSPLPSRAYVDYVIHDNEFINLDMVHVWVGSNGRWRYFEAIDFELNAQRGNAFKLTATDYFATDTDGQITILVKLMDGDIIVAEGTVTDLLREDWSMGIHIKRGGRRPPGAFGYEEPFGFAIVPAYVDSTIYRDTIVIYDSLYVQLSGYTTSNPEIY